MRKTSTIAIAALAVTAIIAVPAAVGKKAKKLNTMVTLTAPSPPAGSTTFQVHGRLKARASCEKHRTVRLNVTGPDGVKAIAEIQLVTPPSGLFAVTITLPEKTPDSPPPTPSKPINYTLTTTVDKTNRPAPRRFNVRRIICLGATTTPITIVVQK